MTEHTPGDDGQTRRQREAMRLMDAEMARRAMVPDPAYLLCDACGWTRRACEPVCPKCGARKATKTRQAGEAAR